MVPYDEVDWAKLAYDANVTSEVSILIVNSSIAVTSRKKISENSNNFYQTTNPFGVLHSRILGTPLDPRPARWLEDREVYPLVWVQGSIW